MASQQVLSALEELHYQLERLEPAIKHVEMAQQVTSALKEIPDKHQKLLEVIIKEDAAFKKELIEDFNRTVVQMQEENRLLNLVTGKIQEQVKQEQQYLSELHEKVKNYYDIIERINFPDRLDKLDNNVSAIVLAVQSVQNRLDNLERNLVDRLKETAEQQKQLLTTLQGTLTNSLQKQKIMCYVTWGIIVIASTVILIVLMQ